MRHMQTESGAETARFAREWNAAFLLIAVVAALLFAAGYVAAAVIAAALCVAAFVAQYSAMRQQNRGFYRQAKRTR